MNKTPFEGIKQTYKDCLEIIKAKNADYANSDDFFKNFRLAETFGISPEKGIIIRMSDKFIRIANLLDKEAAVKDEKIEDTLNDLINYTAILKEYIKSNNTMANKAQWKKELLKKLPKEKVDVFVDDDNQPACLNYRAVGFNECLKQIKQIINH